MSASDPMRRLVSLIPGYGGYREREIRRETDKSVRLGLLARTKYASQCIDDIARFVHSHEEAEDLYALAEKVRWQVLQLETLIRSMEYGYAPLFSVQKIDEKKLDELLRCDNELVDLCEKLLSKTKEALAGVDTDNLSLVRQCLQDAQTLARATHERTEQRKVFLLK